MTDITELAQREKFEAWAEHACAAPWGYLKKRRTTEGYSEQIYTCMWTAWKAAGAELVEALEKAQHTIAEMTSENAALKGSVENAAGCINAAYFEGLSDVLAESSDDRLVDLVKRRLLFAYLPVEAPATDDALVAMGDAVLLDQLEDSRKAIVSQSKIIAELESRTVKLPKPISVLYRRDSTDAHRAIYAYPEAEVNAALDESGIKWEAE